MQPSDLPRLPWGAILCWVLGAAVLAWMAGFAAGTLVRLMVPWAI
jgi:hypothetical protein